MNKINFLLLLLLSSFLFSCGSNQVEDANNESETLNSNHKIVSLNGAITEIISALGHGGDIVGRDVTSTFPENIQESAKDLGHVRTLSIESIMALNPTYIVASDRDINPDLMAKIKESGISYKVFNQEFSVEGTKSLIKQVADVLENDDYQKLIDKIDADLAKLQPIDPQPKVLYIYARGAGTLMIAGANTPMESIIQIAGGENAVKGIEDLKPLTTEALIQSNPDMILLFTTGLQSLGGMDGLLQIPGLEQTTAGKNKAVITMDGGFLTGFGPRVGEAALELNKSLNEGAQK